MGAIGKLRHDDDGFALGAARDGECPGERKALGANRQGNRPGEGVPSGGGEVNAGARDARKCTGCVVLFGTLAPASRLGG
jgi:hypothetical protein